MIQPANSLMSFTVRTGISSFACRTGRSEQRFVSDSLKIEEHESRIVGLEVRESFLTVGRRRDTEALGTQHLAHCFANVFVVVDDENR